jgi:molybdate transport system ATP-binding protein
LLEVRLKKSLPGFNLEVAFTVNRETLAIIGPSGSGKTMTLQCIAGLVRPDEGYIRLNDKVILDTARGIHLAPQTRKVGYVFQNYALFPHLTVKDNIAYGIRHLSRPDMEARVTQLLDTMNITGLGHRYPRQLSAGQQQRVALARAIAPEPEVLLLDEPFSALDTQVKERLELELIALQNYYQGNILFVTHNLTEGYKLASKIAVYESGRVVQCDYKNRVIASPSNRTVARLTGVRNLMRGSITEIRDSSVRVLVPELGGTLKVTVDTAAVLSLDQNVTIGIRPEFIHIIDRQGENAFPCTADRIVEGISIMECFFHVNTEITPRHWVEASLSKLHAPRFPEGHKCYVYLPPEHVAIITD